jgi:hypothetical protein
VENTNMFVLFVANPLDLTPGIMLHDDTSLISFPIIQMAMIAL